jgi:hypothetical protein
MGCGELRDGGSVRQLVTHCVANWQKAGVSDVEHPHVLKRGDRKALPKIAHKSAGKTFKTLPPVSGALSEETGRFRLRQRDTRRARP